METFTGIAPGLGIAETPFRLMGIDFGNRMSVIELPGNKRLLHSPVRPSPGLIGEIRKSGQVDFLMAPNLMHNLFVNAWKKAFPEAKIIAPPGVKRITADITLSCHERSVELETYRDTLSFIPVAGMPALKETALLHHTSRTLILTDLAFNIQDTAGLWSSLAFRLYGAYGRFGPSRLIRALIKDKKAFSASLHQILEHDFDRIIVSHGGITGKDGKRCFKQAFERWI